MKNTFPPKLPKPKRPKFVEDKTSSGHERIGCSRCCKAIVKQPYMTFPSWEQSKFSFRKKHICHKSEDTVPNEDLDYDLIVNLGNGPATNIDLNVRMIKDVIEHFGCEDKVIPTELGKRYADTLKTFRDILVEVLGRKPRIKFIYPNPME